MWSAPLRRAQFKYAARAIIAELCNYIAARSARPEPLNERLRLEDSLHGLTEQLGDPERERETRLVTTRLYGVHRLTRNIQPFRKLTLRPIPGGAELPDLGLYRHQL